MERWKINVAECIPALIVSGLGRSSIPAKGILGIPLLRYVVQLEIDNPALCTDRDSVGPVLRAKFGKDISDVTLHGFLRER